MPGSTVNREHLPTNADKALAYGPPDFPLLGKKLETAPVTDIKPYVTIDVVGGMRSGASSSLLSCVHGSRFTSDWAGTGLVPSWHQTAEAMTTDPTLAFFRICVWNRREHEDDDQLAVAVVPWWCLREGVRVLPLDDIYGRKLARTKLVLRVQVLENIS